MSSLIADTLKQWTAEHPGGQYTFCLSPNVVGSVRGHCREYSTVDQGAGGFQRRERLIHLEGPNCICRSMPEGCPLMRLPPRSRQGLRHSFPQAGGVRYKTRFLAKGKVQIMYVREWLEGYFVSY